jgi:hypothetical protein
MQRLIRDLGDQIGKLEGNKLLTDDWLRQYWGRIETSLPNLTMAMKSEWKYGLDFLRWMKEADKTREKWMREKDEATKKGKSIEGQP